MFQKELGFFMRVYVCLLLPPFRRTDIRIIFLYKKKSEEEKREKGGPAFARFSVDERWLFSTPMPWCSSHFFFFRSLYLSSFLLSLFLNSFSFCHPPLLMVGYIFLHDDCKKHWTTVWTCQISLALSFFFFFPFFLVDCRSKSQCVSLKILLCLSSSLSLFEKRRSRRKNNVSLSLFFAKQKEKCVQGPPVCYTYLMI